MEMPAQKPSSSGRKWLIGLGIGCGGIVVIVIAFFIAGYFFVSNATRGFRESEALGRTLAEKYGRVEDYCPEPDGVVPAPRLEAFLAIRDACGPSRQSLERTLDELVRMNEASHRERRSFSEVMSGVKRGVGMIPLIADFLKVRNQALLDNAMGMGEYIYIYVVAYYGWLKKPVSDGPGIAVMRGGGIRLESDERRALEVSRDAVVGRIRRVLPPMMRCQLERLRSAAAGSGKWAEALAAEIKALEADPSRVPWQDGLPENVALSLQPFRERLEKAYSPMTNLFELGGERD